MSTETITKLAAAERQLDTAITLWFSEADTISIHTLTCSAYEIIRTTNRLQKGHKDILYDSLRIKEEYREKWADALKQHYNFFKHATRDPSKTITFNPTITEIFILCSIAGLELLGIKLNITREAFNFWIYIHRPSLLAEEFKKLFINFLPVNSLREIKRIQRGEFFHSYKLFRSKP